MLLLGGGESQALLVCLLPKTVLMHSEKWEYVAFNVYLTYD